MKVSVFLYLYLIFVFSSAFGQSVQLRLNLPENYHFSTETSVNMTVEQEFMGIRYNTKMEINTLIEMHVQGISTDSNYIISASYRKMDIHVFSLLINMEVNSETAVSGDSLSRILQFIRGKEFKLFLTPKGDLRTVYGLDEMLTESVASFDLPEKQKSEFTRNLIQSLGKDALLDNYRSNRSFYPESRVKAASEWDFQMDLSKSGIPMELYSHIILKSISKNTANLVSSGHILKQDERDSTGQASSVVKISNLSGDEVSEIKMDIRTGLIQESIISQNVSGSISTPSNEETAEIIVIPFKINSRITMNSTPLKK